MKRQRKKNQLASWANRRISNWQFALKQFGPQIRKKWAKSWKNRRDSFKRWQQSRPITKKIREQERQKSAKKFNRSVAKAPKKFKQRFKLFRSNCAKLPAKTVKAVRSSYKRLRKLTFRELVIALWDFYLNVLAYLFRLPRRLIKKWQKQKLWLKALSGTMAMGCIAVILASPILLDMAKEWRANDLRNQANQLIDKEQISLAYEKSRSAALLAPKQEEILAQIVDLADRLKHPHTVWWTERVAKSKNFDPESLARVIERSIEYNQLGTGARYVSVLRSRYPDSQDRVDYELELLLKQGMREEALLKAAQMMTEGNQSPLVHRIFVELSLSTTDEGLQNYARQKLMKEIQREDAIGLELCKLAQRLPQKEREEMDLDQNSIRERILAHPEGTPMDRIEANGFAYYSGKLSEIEAFDAIVSEFDLEDLGELNQALEILSRFEIYRGRDRILAESQIFSDPGLALAYLEWLVLSEEANLDEANRLLINEEERLPISESNRRFWQAMIASQRNQKQEFSLSLLQALENSTPSDWDYMHFILVKHTDTYQQHAFYRELFGRPESPILATERYLLLSYELGLEDELQILLRQIQPERFIKRPESLNFLLYLQAVNERNLTATRTRLERLIGEFPKAALFYRNLAFVYAKSGEFALARSINREIPPPSNESSAYIRLAHAFIMQNPELLPDIDDLPTKSEKALWRSIASDSPSL